MMRKIKSFLFFFLKKTTYGRAIYYSQFSQSNISFKMFFLQKILGFNRKCYWPVHFTSVVQSPEKILVGIDTAPGIMGSCYIQGYGGIQIGDYTQIGPGVGIISLNHNPLNVYDYQKEKFPSVVIGAYCWLGMNTIVLPGVEIGDFTVIGAGSVVTKSFPDGYCVLAGNPARVIKQLNRDECVRESSKNEYCGYIPADRMQEYRAKNLKI